MCWFGIQENASCNHDATLRKYSKMANLKINNNVSTSAISRLEKVIISKLCVVSDFDTKIVRGSRANRPTSIVFEIFRCLQSTADEKLSFWTTIVYIFSV